MTDALKRSLTMPFAAWVLLCASAGGLLFAFVLQALGIEPCFFCLWERVPYTASTVLALAALLWKPYGRNTFVLLILCALFYFAGTGIAIFHTGVEQHWWKTASDCAAIPLQGSSIDAMREALLHTNGPRCDEISWSIFGLSLANMNIAASLGLAIFSSFAAVIFLRRK